jgi:Restriction endonuclease
MSWQQFERLVGEAFRQQGYQVFETGGGGADGGVDLVLTRSGEKHLVQCKQWRAFKVGVDVVRELYGVMAAKGAAGGFVVTSGRFTDEAVAFAQGRNVRLLDGPKLHALLQQARQAPASGMPTTNVPVVATPAPVPVCPVLLAAHDTACSAQGQQRGPRLLGLYRVPNLQGDAIDCGCRIEVAGGDRTCASEGLSSADEQRTFGFALVAFAIAMSVAFVWIASGRDLSSLENTLLQVFSVGVGIVGSYVVGQTSAREAGQDVIKPHARSAFRRLVSLTKSLSRLPQTMQSVRQGAALSTDALQLLDRLEGVVTEQISTAADALEDWRDVLPEEFKALSGPTTSATQRSTNP